MSAADLEIVATGDTSGANASLVALQGNLQKTAAVSKETGSEFDRLQNQLQILKTAASRTFDPAQLKVQQTAIANLSAQLDKMAIAEDKASLEAQAANTKFKEMTVVANNTSVGAQRLSSAIARSTDPLQIAAREVNNFSRRILYMVGGGVMGLAIGAFQELLPLIQEFVTGLDKSSEASKLAAANLQNMTDIMKDANKDAGKQIADLKILYAAATNVNLSMGDRLKAVKALQKEYPDYFGNISRENILNGQATGVYNTLTQAILANARAKAGAAKLEGLQGQKLDIDTSIAKLNDDFKNAVRNIKGDIENLDEEGRVVTVTTVADQIQSLRDKMNKQVDKLHLDGTRLDKEMKYITDVIGGGNLAAAIEKPDKKTKEKKINPFEIDLKKLEDEYKQAQARDVSIKDYLLNDEKVFLEKKAALLKKYGKLEGDNDLAIAKNKEAIHLAELKFEASQIIPSTLNKIKPPDFLGKIDPKVKIFASDDIVKQKEAVDKLNQELEATGQILQKTLLPAFDALFTSLIDGSRRSGESFSKMLTNLFKQLEKTILKALALAAIESIFGGPTFGTALDKALGFTKVFGNASGTSNFQGGLTWVGEHGKELVSLPRGTQITPAAQVAGMGSPNIYIPSLTLRGQDMIVAFNRANARIGRNG